MNFGKLCVYLSSILMLFLFMPQSYAQPHTHGGRSHTHGLPAQGIGHRHNNGHIGRSSKIARSKGVFMGSYTSDQKGCLHYNEKPLSKESLTWTGKCVNGYAEGQGYRQWFRNGKRNGGKNFFLRRGMTPLQIAKPPHINTVQRTVSKTQIQKHSKGNRFAVQKAKSRRILNKFDLPRRRCNWPDVPVFRKRSQVENFKYEKAKPYIRCLDGAGDEDFDDLKRLVKDLGGTWQVKGTQILWKVPSYCECKQEVKRWFSKINKRDKDRVKKGDRFVRLVNKRITKDDSAIRYQEENPKWRKRPKQPLGNGPKRIIIPRSPTYNSSGYY